MITSGFSTKSDQRLDSNKKDKKCENCGKVKLIEEFSQSGSWGMRRKFCKLCDAALQREVRLEKKKQLTVELFGVTIPQYASCDRCKSEAACLFSEGIGYLQPCRSCQSTEAYEKEQLEQAREIAKNKYITDAQQAKLPVAVHEFRGDYLYTNHRGDVIKREKARQMKSGEKYRK